MVVGKRFNYLVLLLTLLACENREPAGHESATGTEHEQLRQSNDSTALQAEQDLMDASQFEEVNQQDSLLIEETYDRIFHIPEAQALNERINLATHGEHGAAIIFRNTSAIDTNYYEFDVGDNSREDRYVNAFLFYVHKKTKALKIFDTVEGEMVSLEQWRANERNRNRNRQS